MFKEIQNSPEELMEKLDVISKRDNYYEVRAEFNQNPTVEHFIYLNKRCFRGLYRVNKKGEFNTSCGKQTNVVYYSKENIMELHRLFNEFDVEFETKDYLDINIEPNSMLYLDSPYYGVYNEYTSYEFDHIEYVQALESLKDIPNIKVFISNSHLFRNVYNNENYI
jgi:DNA adenine methylase